MLSRTAPKIIKHSSEFHASGVNDKIESALTAFHDWRKKTKSKRKHQAVTNNKNFIKFMNYIHICSTEHSRGCPEDDVIELFSSSIEHNKKAVEDRYEFN